ncbi:MAG: hypothetical protein ACXIUD_04950 [Mongoliitalea sp.]
MKINVSNLVLIFIFFFFIVVFCTNKKEEIIDFENEILIQGEAVKDIIVHTNKNINLLVVDTFLVIQQIENNLLSIYSTNDYSLLKSYGSIGEGSLEFSDPYLLKQYSYDLHNKSPIIKIYDYERRVLSEINIFNLLNNDENFLVQKTLGDNPNYYLHFYYFSSDFYLGVTEGESKFSMFDQKSGTIFNVDYFPRLEIELEKSLYYPVYRSVIAVNESKQKIVSSTLLIPNIDLWDFNLKRLESVFFDTTDFLKDAIVEYKKSGKFDSKHFIVELDSNDDYIFGLNYNNSSSAIYKNYDHQNLNLLQFDWEGNPLKKYILVDNKFVESFAVDFERNKVYCFLPHEKEYNIYVYDLK